MVSFRKIKVPKLYYHKNILYNKIYFNPATIRQINAVGTMYFSPKLNNFADILFFIKFCPLIFRYQPEIRHKNRVFSGSIIFEVKKSKNSKSVLSNILKSFKSPNDSVVGIAISEIIVNKIVQAFALEILNLSTRVAQGPSTMLIPDVTAAQNNKIKNAEEIRFPNGICENIFGKVTKTSPAPESGSIPNENTAGKIIIPARIAKVVSDKIIV